MRSHAPVIGAHKAVLALVLAVTMLVALPGSLTQPLSGAFGTDVEQAVRAAADGIELDLPFATGQDVYSAGIHANNGATGAKNAIDFAPQDGLVRAPAPGVARYLFCGGGAWLTIEHADGWRTGYYHLQDVRPKDGEAINSGDLLGRIGNATPCGGGSTGAHVHFSLWRRVVAEDGEVRFAAVELAGHQIGGWLAQPVEGQYGGRLTNVTTLRSVRLPGAFRP